jgi:mono/diheme cytochrome c family protein
MSEKDPTSERCPICKDKECKVRLTHLEARAREELTDGLSCHNSTGVSAITSYATVAGARGVNDRTATNVAQVVISGTERHTSSGLVSMPAFGSTYSDTEIAAVSNYVTARFGSARSGITDKDVAGLRAQTSR